MGAVRIALGAVFGPLFLMAGPPAHADEIARWRPLIAEASVRFSVPAEWIERVMFAESRGRTTLRGRPITSSAGAMGLMQLMPGTWADMRERLGLGYDPHDPRDNILAGTLYLRLMHDKFGYPGLFGAYNAGPGRYGAYLAGAGRLPRETIAYMALTARGRAEEVAAPFAVATASRVQARPVGGIFFAVGRRQPASREGPAPSNLFIVLGE